MRAFSGGEAPRRLDLRQQERCPLNRSGDEVRKERDEDGEVEQAAPGVQLATIDIDRVAHRLKRIKRDPDRQQNAQRRLVDRDSRRGKNAGDVLDEEIEVLEEPEHPEVRDDAQPQEAAAVLRVSLHPAGGAIVDDRGGRNQDQEPRVDVAVEEVAADKEQHVLAARRQRPVHRDEGDEEGDEVEAVEDH